VCVCVGAASILSSRNNRKIRISFSFPCEHVETKRTDGMACPITRKVGCCCLTFENGDRDNDGRLVHTRNRQCGGRIRIDLEGRFVGILIVARLRPLFVQVIQSRNSSVHATIKAWLNLNNKAEDAAINNGDKEHHLTLSCFFPSF
jgi:hypothetical protein